MMSFQPFSKRENAIQVWNIANVSVVPYIAKVFANTYASKQVMFVPSEFNDMLADLAQYLKLNKEAHEVCSINGIDGILFAL